MSRKDRRPSRYLSQSFSLEPELEEATEEGATSAGVRQARLEHVLMHELQAVLRDEASDPALAGVVLIALELSVDQSFARIAYAVRAPLSHEAQVRHASRAALKQATGFLRARLAQQLNLKKLPSLGFAFVGVDSSGSPEPEVGS